MHVSEVTNTSELKLIFMQTCQHYKYAFSLARDKQLAVTVTRSCWGLWDTSTGKLLAQLADAPLGAIVTHAVVTPTGDNVVTAESGNVVIWDIAEQQVLVGNKFKSNTYIGDTKYYVEEFN